MITVSPTKDFKTIATLNENVQSLHATLYPHIFKPYSKAEIEKAIQIFLSDPDCYSFLAMKDGVAIGYAIFFVREAKENAFHYRIKTLYIDQISVLPSHQKHGAGKLLLLKAETLAKEKSISKIELEHWSANTVAASYFRKNGYVINKEKLFKLIE